jgi:hypothetical protein
MFRNRGRVMGLVAVLAGTWCAVAQAELVVQYNFEGSNSAASAWATNITPGVFSLGSTLSNELYDVGVAGGVSTGLSRKASGWATNVVDTKWFGFALTVAPGYRLDVISLTFDTYRKQDGSPSNLLVRCSTNGTTFNALGPADFTGPTNVWTAHAIANPPSNLMQTVYFRIYGYTAPTSARSWRIDNVTLSGVVSRISYAITPGGMAHDTPFSLTFPSFTNARYTVQCRDTLLGGTNWPDLPALSGISGNGGTLVLTDTNSAGWPARFYRVKAAFQ